MLKVLEREVKNYKHFVLRPLLNYNRKQAFPEKEENAVKMANQAMATFGYVQNDHSVSQNANGVVNYVDLQKSKGNYVTDADGNVMLDLVSGEHNPLGHNHELFKNFTWGKDADSAIINSCAADHVASAGFAAEVKSTFSAVAPKGLNGIHLVNQNNATGAAVAHAMVERGNQGWSALYFQGSTHGSPLTLGGRICGWPAVAYPSSAAEESQILENVRSELARMRDTATPIAAVVIEPTQQSSGHSASDNFISSLNGMAKEFEAALVVDETSTGCHSSGSGSFWQYNGYADYVSFGKRTQASGFFSNENGVALAGNENDVRLFSTIQQGISEGGLATRHGDASQKIAQSVAQIPGKVNGVTAARSQGTNVWLETDSAQTNQKLQVHLRSHGILVRANGANGLTARPSMVFGTSQADELTNAIGRFQ